MNRNTSQVRRGRRVQKSRWYMTALVVAMFMITSVLLVALFLRELYMPTLIIQHQPLDMTNQVKVEEAHRAAGRFISYRPADIHENATSQYENTTQTSYISTSELDEFFSRFGYSLGIYFKNLDTGFVYTHNADTKFFGASLNKANHALYTYIAAERGYIDIYAVHTFTAEDWWGGTGVIRFMPAGTLLTTRELLHHAVVYSDNVAFRMLTRYMNNISFSYSDFLAELGANPDFILSTYSHNTSANDTALWFNALHAYLESDSLYGHYLHNDLLNTALYSHPYFTRGAVFGGDYDVNVRLINSGYEVAQKYGWSVHAFNVAGIVYASTPFMLVVISDMDHGAHGLFDEISQLMKDFNARYF